MFKVNALGGCKLDRTLLVIKIGSYTESGADAKTQRNCVYSAHIAAMQLLTLLFSFATHTSGGKIDFQFFSQLRHQMVRNIFLQKGFRSICIILSDNL